ncbi:MAG: hypothetical protein JF565_10710 [Propionibacteriales bacterium]|nr:hypothetical protein [Propionibacteriales bacterium]
MTDDDQTAPGEHEPSFDDPAYDEIRGLLADARVSEPVPTDVAARLDATLAALKDQARTHQDRSSVVSLRRRTVGRVLAAAAAVVLIGAGGFSIVRNAGDGSSNADSAAAGSAADQQAQSDAGSGGAEKSAPNAHEPIVPGALDAIGQTSLRSAHFAQDAAATMRALSGTITLDQARTPTAASPSSSDAPVAPSVTPSDTTGTRGGYLANGSAALTAPPVTSTPGDFVSATKAATGCAGPGLPGAVTLPATLDGVPVALVFHPPTTTAQLVEAWSCDGTKLLASASVPH